MRVLVFTTTFLPQIGGIEVGVHELSNELVGLGCHTTVFAPRYKRDNDTGGSYRLVRYMHPLRGLFVEAVLSAQLDWVVRRERPDVIHAQPAYLAGVLAVATARRHRIPCMITTHGADVQMDAASGYGLRLDTRIGEKIARGLAGADLVTTVSRAMVHDTVEAGAPPDRVRVVPNGVRVTDYASDPGPSPHPKPYIFALGRFVPKKGFDVLIQAFGQVATRYPGDLVIAGTGPERSRYETLISSLDLGGRVHVLGPVLGPEKLAYLSRCDVFACPSRFEPFGIVNLEAMAAGKPIVASAVDGIVDLIEHEESGLLVPPDAPTELAQALLRALTEEGLGERLSASARQRARAYDWEAVARRYLDAYAEAVGASELAV